MNTEIPLIGITPGEPAGIGPDLLLQLAGMAWAADLRVFADPDLLRARAQQLGLQVTLEVQSQPVAGLHQPGHLKVVPVTLAQPVQTGQLNPANAAYVLRCLELACDACQAGELAAMVTGPVHKGVINEAGVAFSGHTEFLAMRTGTPLVVMMLATPRLRVALVTTHLPLAKVSAAITSERLLAVTRILAEDLRTRFALPQPRILVCGLNPHAGENGHMGREEVEIIEPALAILRNEGLHLIGPVPADTAFTPKMLAQADVVLSMYHDQGLPVLKAQGFGEAVNVTLGLPIIRTSVDHGTALPLAGTGQADTGSLAQALHLAIAMAQARRQTIKEGL